MQVETDMPAPVRETLSKRERLCGKKDIEELFSKGRFGVSGCFKYCVRRDNGQDVHRIMISVSKKLFRRAVRRNLLKRRIRESYRRLKHTLPEGGGLDILFIYNTKEILPYSEIFGCVGNILRKAGNGDKR